MRLVIETYQIEEKCKICQKFETKYGRIRKEQERIKRWRKEGGRSASIQAAVENIGCLENEIQQLSGWEGDDMLFGITHDPAGDTKTLDQRIMTHFDYPRYQ